MPFQHKEEKRSKKDLTKAIEGDIMKRLTARGQEGAKKLEKSFKKPLDKRRVMRYNKRVAPRWKHLRAAGSVIEN